MGSCIDEKGHRANPQQLRWIDAVAHSFNDQACVNRGPHLPVNHYYR